MKLAEWPGGMRQAVTGGFRLNALYIRRLQELGGEAGDGGVTVSSDAVNILSIHKSKGLEFP
jgi:superfamily I DNA/RNA helicase